MFACNRAMSARNSVSIESSTVTDHGARPSIVAANRRKRSGVVPRRFCTRWYPGDGKPWWQNFACGRGNTNLPPRISATTTLGNHSAAVYHASVEPSDTSPSRGVVAFAGSPSRFFSAAFLHRVCHVARRRSLSDRPNEDRWPIDHRIGQILRNPVVRLRRRDDLPPNRRLIGL